MEAAEDTRYVLCLNNDGYPVSLEIGTIYEVLPGGRPERGLIRVVDESGEGYLYSAERFAPVEQPQALPSTSTGLMLSELDARQSIKELVKVL